MKETKFKKKPDPLYRITRITYAKSKDNYKVYLKAVLSPKARQHAETKIIDMSEQVSEFKAYINEETTTEYYFFLLNNKAAGISVNYFETQIRFLKDIAYVLRIDLEKIITRSIDRRKQANNYKDRNQRHIIKTDNHNRKISKSRKEKEFHSYFVQFYQMIKKSTDIDVKKAMGGLSTMCGLIKNLSGEI